MKARMFSVLRQILIFLAVIVVIGQWQSRHLPSGDAPLSMVSNFAGESSSIPLKGSIAILYFFAPWCGVCRVSMPNLDTVQSYFPGVSILAVALDFETPDEVKKFASDIGVTIPVLLGSESVRNQWNIDAYPSYVVIDADGKIRGSSIGYSSQLGMILRVLWAKMLP